MPRTLRGRLVRITPSEILIRTESGEISAPLPLSGNTSVSGAAKPGDWVEFDQVQLRVLTPCRAAGPSWPSRVLDPRRIRAMDMRTKVERGIRGYFHQEGFREVRTPILVPCPGMEPHIRPFKAEPMAQGSELPPSFLPTSPEFAMKRLIVGGLERIFQICSAFRDEPFSVTHQPEFTILEWYRAFAGYEDIMRDTEKLFEHLALTIFGKPELTFQGKTISVATPWPRLRVRDLFQEYVQIDLTRATTREDLARECARLGLGVSTPGAPEEGDEDWEEDWDDLYFKIWLNCIEPRLPSDRAVFVTRYPASQAALSVIDQDPDGTRWARRFEAYAGGLELGNAFEELTDPVEQRARFEKDMRLRKEVYGAQFPESPIDEGFLSALQEGMPPSGGIAMGVDRMVMLFADEPELDYTVWLSARDLSSSSWKR